MSRLAQISGGTNNIAQPRLLIAFHKPYGVLSQFTPDGSPNRTLAEFGFGKGVYPIGRLDADSEGLMLLSDEPQWNQRLLDPINRHEREYWAQVERIPTLGSLGELETGLTVQGRATLPCRAWILEPQPQVPARTPPIRFRKTVPTCWIALALIEGKNRQVRRMTARMGHPTLRLIRVRIAGYKLEDLRAGKWRVLTNAERKLILTQDRLD
jgi:23S rRNA pseudouridine2457 synthase